MKAKLATDIVKMMTVNHAHNVHGLLNINFTTAANFSPPPTGVEGDGLT